MYLTNIVVVSLTKPQLRELIMESDITPTTTLLTLSDMPKSNEIGVYYDSTQEVLNITFKDGKEIE